MTQRTKSKFVFAGPSKTAETLFKSVSTYALFLHFQLILVVKFKIGTCLTCNRYVSPEQVPIQYGGLSVDYCDCDPDFTVEDLATALNLKTATKQFVEIICNEVC